MKNYLESYVNEISGGLRSVRATDKSGKELETDAALAQWAREAQERREKNALFLFIGNGASASMAEHFSHDCFQNAGMRTDTCSETAHITAIANDYSFEDVFRYRIARLAGQGDMLTAISSSGNSPNILKGVGAARENGTFVVTLSGKREDNRLRTLGDVNFYVPLSTYGLVESAHAALLHCWLDLFLDTYEGGRH